MKKRKAQMLQPREVGEIYPVTDNSGRVQRLKGCKFTVVYNGVASVDARTLSQMGLYSGGYGSTYTGLEIEAEQKKSRTTKVEYFFREGALFPEPFARANALRDALNNAKTDFVPLEVSGIGAEYGYDLFKESYISGYVLEVYYPVSALENPLFKKFRTHGKPQVVDVRSGGNADKVVVTYRFRDKSSLDKAYSVAMAFKTCILGQMKSNEDTNKK